MSKQRFVNRKLAKSKGFAERQARGRRAVSRGQMKKPAARPRS